LPRFLHWEEERRKCAVCCLAMLPMSHSEFAALQDTSRRASQAIKFCTLRQTVVPVTETEPKFMERLKVRQKINEDEHKVEWVRNRETWS
jgi:hypothetical protein